MNNSTITHHIVIDNIFQNILFICFILLSYYTLRKKCHRSNNESLYLIPPSPPSPTPPPSPISPPTILHIDNENIFKIDDNNIDCSICLDDKETQPIKLKCDHKFHLSCIQTWFNNNNECPLCRKNIK